MKTTTKTINGQEVPVIIHEAVESGEAANNVGLEDMSPTVGDSHMSQAEFLRLMRLHNEKVNANYFVLGGKVSSKEVIEGKARIDKTTGAPILDSDGNQLFYQNRYRVTFTFSGFTLTRTVSEKMYNDLVLGSTYSFTGELGMVKDFGEEIFSPIFHSWEFVI